VITQFLQVEEKILQVVIGVRGVMSRGLSTPTSGAASKKLRTTLDPHSYIDVRKLCESEASVVRGFHGDIFHRRRHRTLPLSADDVIGCCQSVPYVSTTCLRNVSTETITSDMSSLAGYWSFECELKVNKTFLQITFASRNCKNVIYSHCVEAFKCIT
jgi:hypothetical protein